MKIIDAIITDDQITALKSYWENNSDKRYVNWTDGDQLIDMRCVISPFAPEFQIIKSIVAKDFPITSKIWSAYQQQTFAHNIHIDDYESENDNPTFTYVIALDTVPEYKTIVWKETTASNEELHKYVANWAQTKKEKTSNISQTEDLEHTYDQNQLDYMCDYLTLDGIFAYKAGSGCLFNARQLHCTSNWTKNPDLKNRELLQIHVVVPK